MKNKKMNSERRKDGNFDLRSLLKSVAESGEKVATTAERHLSDIPDNVLQTNLKLNRICPALMLTVAELQAYVQQLWQMRHATHQAVEQNNRKRKSLDNESSDDSEEDVPPKKKEQPKKPLNNSTSSCNKTPEGTGSRPASGTSGPRKFLSSSSKGKMISRNVRKIFDSDETNGGTSEKNKTKQPASVEVACETERSESTKAVLKIPLTPSQSKGIRELLLICSSEDKSGETSVKNEGLQVAEPVEANKIDHMEAVRSGRVVAKRFVLKEESLYDGAETDVCDSSM